MNEDYEFISYTTYPDDQYVSASCKMRYKKSLILIFIEQKFQDGGTKWASPGSSVQISGKEKKTRLNAIKDPLVEDEELSDFIKASIRKLRSFPTAGNIQYPHGMGQSPNAPSSMKEVAADEQLPF
jgi:hypothetical protein